VSRDNNYNNKREQRPQQPQGLTVPVFDNDINKALRRLKKLMNNAGIIKEVRDRQHYVKPSDRKRLEKNAQTRRWKKQEKKLRDQGLL